MEKSILHALTNTKFSDTFLSTTVKNTCILFEEYTLEFKIYFHKKKNRSRKNHTNEYVSQVLTVIITTFTVLLDVKKYQQSSDIVYYATNYIYIMNPFYEF